MEQIETTSAQISIQLLEKDTCPALIYSVRAFAQEHDPLTHLNAYVPLPENKNQYTFDISDWRVSVKFNGTWGLLEKIDKRDSAE